MNRQHQLRIAQLTAKMVRLGKYLYATHGRLELKVRLDESTPGLEILCYGADPTRMPILWEGEPVRVRDCRAKEF